MRTVSAHDLAGWPIVSLEERYDYLVQMARGAQASMNQSQVRVGGEPIPGTGVIEDDLDDIFRCQNTLLDVLRSRSFDNDADAEQRRIKLLLLHELTYPGADLPDLIRIALSPSGSLAQA